LYELKNDILLARDTVKKATQFIFEVAKGNFGSIACGNLFFDIFDGIIQ
jgi:hypothetical protein